MTNQLPPLPEPTRFMPPHSRHFVGYVEAYDADQMRAYALAALAMQPQPSTDVPAEPGAYWYREPGIGETTWLMEFDRGNIQRIDGYYFHVEELRPGTKFWRIEPPRSETKETSAHDLSKLA